MNKDINITLKDFPFNHKLKTRWRDLDAFKHVNNATFLSYIEDARIVFFKRWGINFRVPNHRYTNPMEMANNRFFNCCFIR